MNPAWIRLSVVMVVLVASLVGVRALARLNPYGLVKWSGYCSGADATNRWFHGE
jgi:hypothetical protein